VFSTKKKKNPYYHFFLNPNECIIWVAGGTATPDSIEGFHGHHRCSVRVAGHP
jgi:hypothetical protein